MMRPVPLGLLVAVLAIGVDQVTKWWILIYIMDPPRVINVTPFFNLVLVWNRGISFGMFSDESMAGVWILSFLALIIVGFLFNWLRKAESKRVAISLGLIIGGALGNVIDRAVHSAVLDFLDFYARIRSVAGVQCSGQFYHCWGNSLDIRFSIFSRL